MRNQTIHIISEPSNTAALIITFQKASDYKPKKKKEAEYEEAPA